MIYCWACNIRFKIKYFVFPNCIYYILRGIWLRVRKRDITLNPAREHYKIYPEEHKSTYICYSMLRWVFNTNKLYKSLLRENVIHINVYHRHTTICIEHKLLIFF